MVFVKNEANDGLGDGVLSFACFFRIELSCGSAPAVVGPSPGGNGGGLGLRFVAAGGPRIFTPADLMITSLEEGASNTAVLKLSWLQTSARGHKMLTGGEVVNGASGVAGDESTGVGNVELER